MQTSVVRTNCMDCLDRTNVVQSVLARIFLTRQLRDVGILEEKQLVEDTGEFERNFKAGTKTKQEFCFMIFYFLSLGR